MVSQYTAANIKNDDAQHAALSQQHKDTLKAQKDALVPFVAQRRHMLRMKPHLEPFMMGKLLVPGVQFSIQFYMNAPELIFDAVTIRGKIREIKMKMYLCVVRLNDTIFRSLMSKMTTQKQIVKYPTVRSKIATRSFRQGERILEIQNPFQSRIPDFIMAALVNTAAFNGAYDRDPFCFEKSRVTSFKQFIRREEYPYESMDLYYNDGQKYWTGYHRFLQASGCMTKGEPNMVLSKDWGQYYVGAHVKNGNCILFAIDNVANGCVDCPYVNPKQSGDIVYKIFLGTGGLPADTTVLLFAEFENLIEVDSNQAVLYDIVRGRTPGDA